MELYFVNDQPTLIFDTFKYARTKPNCRAIEYNGNTYYICDAKSYGEAIEQLILRSRLYENKSLRDEFKRALIHATGLILDVERGDGFTFMMIPFENWHEMLVDYITPKEYQ